jgi:hypothetical protein
MTEPKLRPLGDHVTGQPLRAQRNHRRLDRPLTRKVASIEEASQPKLVNLDELSFSNRPLASERRTVTTRPSTRDARRRPMYLRAAVLSSATPPMGFVASRRNQLRRSLRAGLPPRHLPLSGFLTLPAVSSRRSLVALFHATSVHRLSASRAFSARSAGPPLGVPCSLAIQRGLSDE